jgi:hypothetical protein
MGASAGGLRAANMATGAACRCNQKESDDRNTSKQKQTRKYVRVCEKIEE